MTLAFWHRALQERTGNGLMETWKNLRELLLVCWERWNRSFTFSSSGFPKKTTFPQLCSLCLTPQEFPCPFCSTGDREETLEISHSLKSPGGSSAVLNPTAAASDWVPKDDFHARGETRYYRQMLSSHPQKSLFFFSPSFPFLCPSYLDFESPETAGCCFIFTPRCCWEPQSAQMFPVLHLKTQNHVQLLQEVKG